MTCRALVLATASALTLTVAGCSRDQNGQAAGGASGEAYADSGYVVGTGANAPPPAPPRLAPRRQYARYAPPPIPTYDQPPPPADGYIWTPGYWAWTDTDEDYYWVPGVWVEPPDPGVLWTPGYWAMVDDEYVWSPGFWAATVGFYGGVDYGWGYSGRGYYGGRWQDNHFYYNASVNNLGPGQSAYVYRQAAQVWTGQRVSYNGGPGGIRALPTPLDEAALSGRRAPPTSLQAQQIQAALAARPLRASINRGRPPVVATSRAGVFQGPGVVTQVRTAARYNPPPRPATGRALIPGGQAIPGHAVAPAAAAVAHGAGFGRAQAPVASVPLRAGEGQRGMAVPVDRRAAARGAYSQPYAPSPSSAGRSVDRATRMAPAPQEGRAAAQAYRSDRAVPPAYLHDRAAAPGRRASAEGAPGLQRAPYEQIAPPHAAPTERVIRERAAPERGMQTFRPPPSERAAPVLRAPPLPRAAPQERPPPPAMRAPPPPPRSPAPQPPRPADKERDHPR